MRTEKALQGWINTSLALSFNNEDKTGESEVTNDPPECPSHNNIETVEDHNNKNSRHSIAKNSRGNYILGYETMQLDTHFIPTDKFLAAANTQALYHAHLRAQMKQTVKQATKLPNITNQGTSDNHLPSVKVSGASSPPVQPPVLPQLLAPKKIKIVCPSFSHKHKFQFHNPGDLKHQV